MAAKEEKISKRKRSGDSVKEGIISKKPNVVKSNSTKHDDGLKKKTFDKSSKGKKPQYDNKPDNDEEKKEPKTKREARHQAKELAEARKKKRKRHYTLEQELALLWEKMRRRNISKQDRSALVSQALQKMTGTIPEIAGSHVSSRVLQTCVKFCTQAERDAVFEELKPSLLTLACNVYAVHLVKKMLDNASKKQLEGFISSLHGHVASLLRHMVGYVHFIAHTFKVILAGNDYIEAYRRKSTDNPHVYVITDTSIREMTRDEVIKSIIISDKSGAGKTETTKITMQYLVALGRGSGIENEILKTNPILEAFGEIN